MNLKNYSYPQSKLVRYLAILYLFFFLGFCGYLYLADIGVSLIIVLLNFPIALLIYASFSKKVYFTINENHFEVYNSFKAITFQLNDIQKIEQKSKNWVLHLSNNQKVNLSDMRVAESDKVYFQEQMKVIQEYLT